MSTVEQPARPALVSTSPVPQPPSQAATAAATFAVRIDARPLSYRGFLIPGVTPTLLDARAVQTLQLAPGTYSFQFASGYYAALTFRVTATGTIEYDPAYTTFLAGAGSDTLILNGFLVTLDASRLSGLGILPVPGDKFITYQQVRWLPANFYRVQTPGGSITFTFRLGLDGLFSYDPSFDIDNSGFLNGSGTSTLEFIGYPFRLDATALLYKRVYVPGLTGTSGVDARTISTFQVLPGAYSFQFASGYYADFRYLVTQSGRIDYDSRYATFLSGAGSTTLRIDGLLVTLDARRLSGAGVILVIPEPNWIRYQQVRLVPAAHYQVIQGSGSATFEFALGTDGQVRYVASLDVANGGFLAGNGTGTIEFVGYPVCVDVRPLGASVRFTLYPIREMPMSTAPIGMARLLPHTRLTLQTNSAGITALQFALSVDGTISLAPQLSPYLRVEQVNGLTVLTVLGLPPG